MGFILSGDGSDHSSMDQGEFHMFDEDSMWTWLTPHPGNSRWAPGSFVMRGSARAYFTSGKDRSTDALHNDLWMVDLSLIFETDLQPVFFSEKDYVHAF